MPALIDRLGQRVGKLEVIKLAPRLGPKDQGARWLCRCDCGNEKTVRAKDLMRPGNTQSCGCHRLQLFANQHRLMDTLSSPNQRVSRSIVLALADAGGSLRGESLPTYGSAHWGYGVRNLAARLLVREFGGCVTLTKAGAEMAADLRRRGISS